MKLIDKVSFAGCVVGFVYVCANRSCAPYDLIDQYTSALTSIDLIADSNDLKSKPFGSGTQFRIFHKNIPFGEVGFAGEVFALQK